MDPSLIHNVDDTLGAIFVGFAAACAVYGVLTTQVFDYFRRYSEDRTHLKFVVTVIMLLETIDQAFIGHLSYYYIVRNFNNPIAVFKGPIIWSLILQLTVGSIVGAIVKVSFGLRVWRFSRRNYFITGLILLLAFGQLGLALAFTIEAFKLPSLSSVQNLIVLGTISLATGVATDIVTACALCYFLNKLRTGNYGSDSLIGNLTRYAINTGCLTSAVSVTTLILFNVMKHNLYYLTSYFVLSKLYAISYLATLNTRRIVGGRGTDGRESPEVTNMFRLGTRVPEGGLDYDRGEDLQGKPEFVTQDFPYNSFASPYPGKRFGRPLV